ncbi:cysteine desulfurase family protein [Halothermothrix orenii]|uniref:Aminotransferase class V n=1 Tax=Halothermothrix orenii (strain H 168 / OCM 544 / DSM 9562) TaxID=373903 RepID=B8D0L4_HALOH|nr:cysteine desulfurase family protein [Halothermothrix orenii]ACL70950.1 aminotransferase class V [Halothermothrix orenii H 168]
MKEIYLDNSATTRPLPEVVSQVEEVLTTNYGNPSSLHNKGLSAEKILKEARQTIAGKLNVKPDEIIFTSGGTESNNLALKGTAYLYKNRGRHLITTKIEHASVIDTFKALEDEGFEVTYLKPDKRGIISLEELKRSIRDDTILISIMHINNELGSLQPIAEAGSIIKDINKKTIFHVDAVQSFGKVLIKPADWNIDLLTISAHKVHGPKGVGALYKRKNLDIKPLLNGGGQEDGLRSGTENIPGIAGFIPAVKALPDFNERNTFNRKLDRLKNHLIDMIKEKLPDVRLNTPEQSAPHIVNISIPRVKGEVVVHSLEAKGIYVSTGSACHSREREKSHVLRAIGLPSELIDGTIRISLSEYNTETDLNTAVKTLAEQLRYFF